jgi:hypothetical protein
MNINCQHNRLSVLENKVLVEVSESDREEYQVDEQKLRSEEGYDL